MEQDETPADAYRDAMAATGAALDQLIAAAQAVADDLRKEAARELVRRGTDD